MKNRTFTDQDITVSEIGFGTAGLGNLYKPVNTERSVKATAAAMDAGIRYYDTAPHYGAGLSERRLGVALHDLNPGNAILSTKVGRLLNPEPRHRQLDGAGFISASPFSRQYDYSYDGVMRSFDASQQRLGVSSIDILLMHDLGRMNHKDQHEPMLKQALDGGFKAMRELKDAGLVKAIGLGVNEWEICEQVMSHEDIDCVMVANCFTLLQNSITDSFVDKCHARNVSIIAAAPFNSGVLATGSKGDGHFFYGDVPKEIIERVIRIESVCDEFSIPLQAAAINYPLRFPSVKSVVIGMSNETRVKQNIDWYQTDIPEEFWQRLLKLGLVNNCPIAQADS